jgi:hypothetical protein
MWVPLSLSIELHDPTISTRYLVVTIFTNVPSGHCSLAKSIHFARNSLPSFFRSSCVSQLNLNATSSSKLSLMLFIHTHHIHSHTCTHMGGERERERENVLLPLMYCHSILFSPIAIFFILNDLFIGL